MSGVPRAITIITLGIIIFSLAVSARNLDVNRDGKVDIIDATAVQNNLNRGSAADIIYDVNNDGSVTVADFDIVFRNIGLDCSVSPVSCDYDDDGVFADDACPATPEAEASSVFRQQASTRCTGCGISERDVDFDGVMDMFDRCVSNERICLETRGRAAVDQFGCTAGQGSLLLEDLFIPADKVVYSSQIKTEYNNIYIYGRLEVIDELNLTAKGDFILDGIINANGSLGEPGKKVSLAAKRFFIEGTEIDLAGSASCDDNGCVYAGPNADLINRHIHREANDGGYLKQCDYDPSRDTNQYLQQSCGLCGDKTSACEQLGIWGSQSSCLNQGVCAPGASQELLLQGAHIQRSPSGTTACVGSQVNIVETYQSQGCSESCSYEYEFSDRSVETECIAGQCGATCTTGASGECGKCGTLSCDSTCSSLCQNEGQCYPGQLKRETCGQCGVFEQLCGARGSATQCQWETTQACKELVVSEPGCDAPGKTRTVGNCEVQTCTVRCDLSGTDGKPILYWKATSAGKEYPPNSESPPDVEIEGSHLIGCDGTASVYARTMQRKATDTSCNVITPPVNGTYNQTTAIIVMPGQCGYCTDGTVLTSGQSNACASVTTCINSRWVTTRAGRQPEPEQCGDGIDNDCNGAADESCNVIPPPQPQQQGEVTCNYGCADLNQDGTVDYGDVNLLSLALGVHPGDPLFEQSDWDNNGIIELTRGKPDIACFSRYFGDTANKDFGPACNKCNDLDNGNPLVSALIEFPARSGVGLIRLQESCGPGLTSVQEHSCLNQFDSTTTNIPCNFGCDQNTGLCKPAPAPILVPAADCSCAKSDLNNDGQVSVLDIAVISQRFASSQLYHPAADLNNDGEIGVLDIASISQCFGKSIDASCPDVSVPPLP
ncbi:MAG TPA: dockerin type I domain-containing protein [Candidatus Nanoarchaeia archaeon]|nr:dockerin type I domain-containing protein [Candidatus Nanoarchaeia archaeon]